MGEAAARLWKSCGTCRRSQLPSLAFPAQRLLTPMVHLGSNSGNSPAHCQTKPGLPSQTDSCLGRQGLWKRARFHRLWLRMTTLAPCRHPASKMQARCSRPFCPHNRHVLCCSISLSTSLRNEAGTFMPPMDAVVRIPGLQRLPSPSKEALLSLRGLLLGLSLVKG